MPSAPREELSPGAPGPAPPGPPTAAPPTLPAPPRQRGLRLRPSAVTCCRGAACPTHHPGLRGRRRWVPRLSHEAPGDPRFALLRPRPPALRPHPRRWSPGGRQRGSTFACPATRRDAFPLSPALSAPQSRGCQTTPCQRTAATTQLPSSSVQTPSPRWRPELAGARLRRRVSSRGGRGESRGAAWRERAARGRQPPGSGRGVVVWRRCGGDVTPAERPMFCLGAEHGQAAANWTAKRRAEVRSEEVERPKAGGRVPRSPRRSRSAPAGPARLLRCRRQRHTSAPAGCSRELPGLEAQPARSCGTSWWQKAFGNQIAPMCRCCPDHLFAKLERLHAARSS